MKTNSTVTMKTPRIIARVLSAIIVSAFLLMFIGSSIQSAQRINPVPLTLYTIIQLTLFGIGILGLAIAWKWEMAGGVISFLAFITVFFVNPEAWVIFIFPANAILFFVVGYRSKYPKIKLVE